MKTTLRTSAEVLILIGAILSTILNSIYLIATFIFIIPIFWFALLITFTWVTRHQVLSNDSRNWIIFGIIISTFSNWVGLAGYICMLIENIQNEQRAADHKSFDQPSPFNNQSSQQNEEKK